MNLKDKMDLLGIQDVTTNRQHRNGTVVWRLPIKYSKDKFLEVASFKSGYVRNQNGGYTNYQLNKRCESEPQYYPEYDRNGKKTSKYVQFTTRTCKLIPNEKDRLEYLISYCLKNYYIKNANKVINGDYVSEWYHEWCLERATSDSYNDGVARWRDSEVNDHSNCNAKIHQLESSNYKFSQKIKDQAKAIKVYEERVYQHDHDRIKDLEEKLDEANNQIKKLDDFIVASETFSDSMYEGRNDRVKELEGRVYELESQVNVADEKLAATKVRQDVSVIVNGHRYKVL